LLAKPHEGGSALIKLAIPSDIATGTRNCATEEGVALWRILDEGIAWWLQSRGMAPPKRGRTHLKPGRRVADPMDDELPIVILDDEIAA